MTLQAVRDFFQQPIATAVHGIDNAIPVLTDNQFYTDDDAESEFVLVRLNFGATTEPVFADDPKVVPGTPPVYQGAVERLRGALVIEIFTRKGVGPGKGQRIATEVMKNLNGLPRHTNKTAAGSVGGAVNSIVGPSFSALDGRPHFMTRLSCSIQASYT